MRRRDRALLKATPPEAAVPAAPMAEALVADTRRNLSWPPGTSAPTYNPDALQSRHGGLRIYDDMRTDDQVHAAYAFRVAACIGPGWRLEPATDDPADREFADLLTKDLLDLPGTFESVLREMMTAVCYGFSLAEGTWKLDDGLQLDTIKVRAPHHIEFSQDGFGNVTGVRQLVMGSPELFPPEKFIHYVNRSEFDNPYGQSDLRPAYPLWFAKGFVHQLWMIWNERYADPPAYLKLVPGTPTAQRDEMLNILNRLQARTSFALPSGVEALLLESGRQPREVFQLAIEYCNLGIARSLFLPEKSGMTAGKVDGGSFALAQVQADTGVMLRNLEANALAACVQRQLLVPMSQYRDATREVPQFKLQPLTQDNASALVTAWNQAVTAGVVISDGRDENHIRQLLKMPELGEDEQAQRDAMRAAKAAQAQVAADVAANGGSGNGSDGPKKPGGKPAASDKPTPPDAKATDTAKLASSGGFWRALTGPEVRADMAGQRATLDQLTADFGATLTTAVRDLIADLRKRIERQGLAAPDASPAEVQSLTMASGQVSALRKAIEVQLTAVHEQGGTKAAAELASQVAKFSEAHPEAHFAAKRPGLVGTKALRYFKAKTFTIVDLLVDPILAKAKLVLYNAIKGDNPQRVTLANLDEAMGEWLPEVNRGGQEVNVPARLENIARTNIAEAWSEGRWAAMTDPDLPDGFVEAMQYSAILDDRTRENHAAWDSVVKPASWWLGPPDRRPLNGYQCRCQLVPTFPWDGLEITDDADLPSEVIPDAGFR